MSSSAVATPGDGGGSTSAGTAPAVTHVSEDCVAFYRGQGLQFLPFLPCDNADSRGADEAAPEEADAADVVMFASQDIAALLRMPYAHFLRYTHATVLRQHHLQNSPPLHTPPHAA